MASVEDLIELLTVQLENPFVQKESIARFQAIVWDGLDPGMPAEVRTILRDLAHDLDYFERDRLARAEEKSLYGHDRLVKEIRSAVEKLRAALDQG
jgi:hypothetical protein